MSPLTLASVAIGSLATCVAFMALGACTTIADPATAVGQPSVDAGSDRSSDGEGEGEERARCTVLEDRWEVIRNGIYVVDDAGKTPFVALSLFFEKPGLDASSAIYSLDLIGDVGSIERGKLLDLGAPPNSSYATCQFCLLLSVGCTTAGECAREYVPVSGKARVVTLLADGGRDFWLDFGDVEFARATTSGTTVSAIDRDDCLKVRRVAFSGLAREVPFVGCVGGDGIADWNCALWERAKGR